MLRHSGKDARFAIAFGVAWAALLACVDFDGLTGGLASGEAPDKADAASDDARTALADDARTAVADGGSGDLDADAVDVTTTTDAHDANQFWCQGQPANLILCDDFDQAPLMARWDGGQGISGATYFLDTASSTSAPNALVVSSAIWKADSGTPAFALLNQTIASSVVHVHVEFDLRMDRLGDAAVQFNEAYPMQFRSQDYYLRLKVLPSGALAVEQQVGSVFTRYPFARQTDPTQWSHISFDVSLAAPSLIVTQNGVDQINTTSIDPSTATGDRSVAIGLYWASSTDWQSRFDNVTIAGY